MRKEIDSSKSRGCKSISVTLLLLLLQILPNGLIADAQTIAAATENSLTLTMRASLAAYVDQTKGMTVDEAVNYALEHNAELQAVRLEVDVSRALLKQAGFRPNPSVEVRGSKQVNGSDNGVMVEGMLPLELGGRRNARILVAQRELEMREAMLSDRERMLAGEVRAKFGETLAEVYKLGLSDDLVTTGERGFRLVSARVQEGNSAPLEQNQMLVEVNRLRSMREMADGRVRVAMLELKNIIGMTPEDPLRLKGDLNQLLEPLPSITEATSLALNSRPDLAAARAAERLAEAQIEQARAEGRPDAALTAGYQRMKQGFGLDGIDDTGGLQPIEMTSHTLTAGVTVTLPVRNKNQGMIEAAVNQAEAAKKRREFAELTIRREVATSYARYERASRAMEIFRVGVQQQANANLEVIRKTYELGAKTLIDYISEERRYIEVETGYIDAVLETYRARVEIARASFSTELIKK